MKEKEKEFLIIAEKSASKRGPLVNRINNSDAQKIRDLKERSMRKCKRDY